MERPQSHTVKKGNRRLCENANTMRSYRAKAQGVGDCIVNVPDINLRGVTLWTDNHRLINPLNQRHPLDPIKAEWDLVEPIRICLQKTETTVSWVKSHQKLLQTSRLEVKWTIEQINWPQTPTQLPRPVELPRRGIISTSTLAKIK